ncbi:MAG: peptide-methionine (S)-S-oxide reductase MsrA [Acidobacteria bacterium]|nr:peptide-methionine (S)-S-oxide reductase MsrA [Acidobacteriota bacterium]
MMHTVLGTAIDQPVGAGMEEAVFGMGCFWGVERKFWKVPGVVTTSVVYAGGSPAAPTYQQVCTSTTGHAEVVRVVFDPAVVSYDALLDVFWENHDPTQGNRQGNDVGSQYRSVIFTYSPAQRAAAEASRAAYQARLAAKRFGPITTEISDAPPYYLAEEYHQQYLDKNPNGYCGMGGTGVPCR